MKQHHPTPTPAAGSPPLAGLLQPAGSAQPLALEAGQSRLVWLDAGSELRSLSGTALLRSTALATPYRLHPHAAWRNPQGAWIGIEAEGAPARLELSVCPVGRDAEPPSMRAHEKSRPGRGALQRLWLGLRKRFVRRAQPAG
ncbi:hypothetical protein HNP48_005520 [Acidovorax soli]|uniref:Uncharacterized protein n=1 Tax=Acidovorax soli TaxID=592050 RepID=A0A7X0PJL9_9BURK|nr:hypothetical protein [Acidovorax soli]MBB6562804.1 hypothetical protein [Acidovorax soli]